jgi:ABC-type phosphate transport system substrate-binding protein
MTRLTLSVCVSVLLVAPALVLHRDAAAASMAADFQRPGPREDHLAVIVNRSNPIEDLSFGELRRLALAQRTQWPNGRKVTVALHEPGPVERQAVLQLVYRMNEAGFTRHFLQATFTGQIANGPRLLASSEGVRRFVVNVPGAVGFVNLADADASVKTLRIDGRTAGSPDYALVRRTDAPN